ncbi:RHS repeat-associated core domain-containing protein [Silvanigrella paludirubra]|uniref:RHS repeat-associated core domain-containing protein n=1 Tax=Silvanigrella paludirubra TaxID=2499159 RepID=UPI001386D2E4|nr:RHS repeat-associated core domain-containing protein [Silvanigrella paludirubra]
MIKDHVGAVSQVIDIDSHKIVERNASEPFGLSRGIPLLSKSILASYKEVGNRQDVSLYTNPQSNMRDNWEGKSFEILGSSNSNELQGMRGTEVFAKGKFSASTGLSNMGVRTLDSARGVWLSPDLYMGRNLEGIVDNPLEANLFQYANNNPITNNDPTGMASWNDTKSKINDACNGKVSSGNSGHDMTKSPGNGGKNDHSNNSRPDIAGGGGRSPSGGNGGSSAGSARVGITASFNSFDMLRCGIPIAFGAGLIAASVASQTAALAATVPSGGISIIATSPVSSKMAFDGGIMALVGLKCISDILMNASSGSGGGGDYSNLKDSKSAGPGKNFTSSQKQKIIEANKAKNNGVVKSDKSYIDLVKPQKSEKGVTPNRNEWQIDHITPKDKGGTNSFSNAQVLSRQENRIKWNK